MRTFGIFLVVFGVIWALVAFNMDTTVTTDSETYGSGEYSVSVPSMTVQNLGLMETRRNHLMFSGLTILIGVVLIGFGSISRKSNDTELRACPACAELIQPAAMKCRYCNTDLPDSFRSTPHVAPGIPMDASDQEIMQHYGISYERGMYIHGTYHYDHLSQAVTHAKAELQRHRAKV